MEAIRVPIKFNSRSETHHFYPIGDTHLGAAACEEKRLKRLIRKIANEENSHVILMGDIIDAITRTDPRFESSGLADWIPTRKVSEIANVQLDYAFELFSPIKDKILGALIGNHEDKLTKHYGVNIHSMLCNMLQCQNLDYSAVMRLNLIRATESRFFKIYLHHGHGGGRKMGAKINRLIDLSGWFPADLYLFAHVHERGWLQQPMIDLHPQKEELIDIEWANRNLPSDIYARQ